MQFICPKCKEPLAIPLNQSEMQDGVITSSCGEEYQILDNIPRFVPIENYATSFGLQWNTHARTQLDSFTGRTLSRDRFFTTTQWPERMDGELILEGGCGAGRFTEVVAQTGARVFSFDLSRSVEGNYESNKRFENVTIFQANIFHIPMTEASFDRVFCFGTVQFTPDPKRAFMSLVSMLKPGGKIVIDAYGGGNRKIPWNTTHFIRPITKRMPPKTLYTMVEKSVPYLLPFKRRLRTLGKPGRFLSYYVPVVDDREKFGLEDEQSIEWSILNTYDTLAPHYINTQTVESVRAWFEEAGLEDIWVGKGANGVNARGTRPKA